jgi:isoleucyl-tRNA synthetase
MNRRPPQSEGYEAPTCFKWFPTLHRAGDALYYFETDAHVCFARSRAVTNNYALTELARYAAAASTVVEAYGRYDYPTIFQAINQFTTVDLSAFYADVSKDRLYTFGAVSKERRSAQTAMYTIADGLVRLLAPILSVTADELWRHSNEPGNDSGPVINGVTEITRAMTLGSTGWSQNTSYAVEVELTTTHLRLWVNGILEIDYSGDLTGLTAESFGFYTFSQAQAQFRNFTTPIPQLRNSQLRK